MNFDVSTLPAGSRLVRVLVGDGPEYDRLIVVTEEQGGAVLFLQGWIGRLPDISAWFACRDAHFPAASGIRYVRKTRRGEREVMIPIGRMGEAPC